MVDINDICGHPDPAWGSQADTLVMCELGSVGMPGHWEQLWAKRLDDERFMLCCIPFFTSEYSLGDTVTTTPAGGFELSVAAVVERSNSAVIHALFHEDATPEETRERQDDLIENCHRLGLDYEIHQLGYVAISCPIGSSSHTEIEQILHAYHLLEWGNFETSNSSR